MNRKEFLEILRSQLAGQMQEGKAAAHIRYYEDYIQSQVIDLSTWHGRAVVIAAAAVIIVLLILIIGVAIPFFIILAIILYFLSWLKKRNDQ